MLARKNMILNLKLKIKDRSTAFKLVGELNLNEDIEVEELGIDGKKIKANNKTKKK